MTPEKHIKEIQSIENGRKLLGLQPMNDYQTWQCVKKFEKEHPNEYLLWKMMKGI